MAAELFKEKLIELLIESDDKKTQVIVHRYRLIMKKFFLPVRKSESHELKFLLDDI